MTGKKYRKQLGLSDPRTQRAYGDRQFRLCAKFRAIKRNRRMHYLKKMAEKVIISRTLEEIKQFRAGFDQNKIRHLSLTEKSNCFTCSNVATLRHHVIQLQNGGRNKRNNIVPLCSRCHGNIHPHLNRSGGAVASRHSVQPKINGSLSGYSGTSSAVSGA
jgi:5-methylcytosine-specific restriction endonuclease McrA